MGNLHLGETHVTTLRRAIKWWIGSVIKIPKVSEPCAKRQNINDTKNLLEIRLFSARGHYGGLFLQLISLLLLVQDLVSPGLAPHLQIIYGPWSGLRMSCPEHIKVTLH